MSLDNKLSLSKFLSNILPRNILFQSFDQKIHGGRFFSHSVKSPLTTLQVCLSELEQLTFDQKNSVLDKYLHSASLATKQIHSLVELSTQDCFKSKQQLNVKEFFQKFKTLFKVKNKTIKVIIILDLLKGKEQIRMNEYFFFELMNCLINNGIEAYKVNCKNKVVTVLVFLKNKKLQIQVQDFGKGLGFLDQKIMTLKNFTTKGKNRGFGLWFVKEMVNKVNGKLKIYSSLENGTIVVLNLPLS